ncbi:MAG TPA: 5'/3'-nucleotidase SurE [Thermoflexia bacterium]|nr:5'/3'-nucleotidase SurE [Thermoflexia bacterium]
MNKPLILVTNDDGIHSHGLWAAAAALLPLGEVLVVAPNQQWSGAGRSMLGSFRAAATQFTREIAGKELIAYAVNAAPAAVVVHALLELAARKPALVVSGINLGANISTEVTISGTVGAALEAAAAGIPALAVSLALPIALHNHATGAEVDYRAAQAFTRRFAQHLLSTPRPYDTHVLNLNIPQTATPEQCDNEESGPGYRVMAHPEQTAPDSDIYTLNVDKLISVTPLSLDLTARTSFGTLAADFHRTVLQPGT